MTPATAYGHELRTSESEVREALAGAAPRPYWWDDPSAPAAREPLREDAEVDLLVIGGGYCGLWTALLALEREPGRRVMVLEADRIGGAASGRNGGFCDPSLTHGDENGRLHFPTELEAIERLARHNFAGFQESIARHGIDCELEIPGQLTVATEPHQIPYLREAADRGEGTYVDGAELAALASSPLYRAGLMTRGIGLVHPAKLAWGLADAAERQGAILHERSEVSGLEYVEGGVIARTASGRVRARRVALATNGFRSLLPRLRPFTVPIYDYALVTEPLSREQLATIGWTGRHGIADAGREFHYYRKTADDRILFGGYDAVYHRGGSVREEHDQRPETFRRLADHFALTFPQLAGTRFTHAWGGMIDMSTQLVAFHGVAKSGRVAYSSGFTGLGVVATRFGAETMLDLLDGASTPRTRLRMARRLPIPIPPEPLATPLIRVMQRAVARSDRRGGRDGMLLKLASLFKIGFDS